MLILVAFAALAGSALGSFSGVVASRGWRQSLVGRSRCDSCERSLRWFDTVPVASYLALRGRCRTCNAAVGWAPVAWELGGAAAAALIAAPVGLALGL